MAATILDGKAIANDIRKELGDEAQAWTAKRGITPCLAAVLVGDHPASEVYVRSKQRACEQSGLASQLHRLPPDCRESDLLELIERLNRDSNVHGILVQLPLPGHLRETKILDAIDPMKDVDAFHAENVGRICQGRPRYLPCTPHGIVQMLHRSGIKVSGTHAVVIGRSEIVGKPMAMMLMNRDSTLGPNCANATVTVCHSRTAGLSDIARQADLLIAAIGKPRFVTAEMVKPGAVVVDVGINRVGEKLVGDVDFEPVKEVAGHITPVPGGVGPLTVAMLLYNTLLAAKLQNTNVPV